MAYFSGFHTMAGVTFHSVSVWLTVYLACFRKFYLKAASINFKNENSLHTIFYQKGYSYQYFWYYVDQSDLNIRTNGSIFKI